MAKSRVLERGIVRSLGFFVFGSGGGQRRILREIEAVGVGIDRGFGRVWCLASVRLFDCCRPFVVGCRRLVCLPYPFFRQCVVVVVISVMTFSNKRTSIHD